MQVDAHGGTGTFVSSDARVDEIWVASGEVVEKEKRRRIRESPYVCRVDPDVGTDSSDAVRACQVSMTRESPEYGKGLLVLAFPITTTWHPRESRLELEP